MIEFSIPGRGNLKLEHLVIDIAGTLSLDGRVNEKFGRKIFDLRDRLQVHLVGSEQDQQLDWLGRSLGVTIFSVQPAQLIQASNASEAVQKASYVLQLGAEQVAAIGQGADDIEMLRLAALGICVLSPEGLSVQALLAADLLMPDIGSAIELFFKPMRVVSSLRS